jgi:ABC-2 type transport system ATP-binding protein
MTTHDPAVLAEGVRKRYGPTVALDGLDLAVPAGMVCALLGPNGAGKTTAVRVLGTLLRMDGGRAQVAGIDVRRHPVRVRTRIGLVGQHAAVDEVLTGRQNLVLFGRLFHLDRAAARRRAGELLDRFGLADAADRAVSTYSGGMRRRLDLAAGLILAPAVLFLDEPTTGLDPRARTEVHQAVRDLVAGGTTVLLTTQYLDEADQLADRLAVLDLGRVIADGTPRELKAALGADRLDVVVRSAAELPLATEKVARVTGAEPVVDADARLVSAPAADRVAVLTGVARELADAGLDAEDIALRRPTLDEVFLALTGQPRDAGPQREELPA